MAATDLGDAALFNATESTTMAPPSYYATPKSDFLSQFLDRPLQAWHTAVLFAICVVALSSCAVFLALRYAEIFSHTRRDNDPASPTLEAQIADSGQRSFDESPTRHRISSPATAICLEDNEIRRRTRARGGPLTVTVVGKVQESKLAQRRASRAGSIGRVVHGQESQVLVDMEI
jgi:hypothetical protein